MRDEHEVETLEGDPPGHCHLSGWWMVGLGVAAALVALLTAR